ncbi:hypothetical protein FQR65_LT17588 [Abscondita terminalis]|nr:hypothetical protein FQR65_LT17588 [Abscondita terminalis]
MTSRVCFRMGSDKALINRMAFNNQGADVGCRQIETPQTTPVILLSREYRQFAEYTRTAYLQEKEPFDEYSASVNGYQYKDGVPKPYSSEDCSGSYG